MNTTLLYEIFESVLLLSVRVMVGLLVEVLP